MSTGNRDGAAGCPASFRFESPTLTQQEGSGGLSEGCGSGRWLALCAELCQAQTEDAPKPARKECRFFVPLQRPW